MLVVGVFFEAGKASALLEKIWKHAPGPRQSLKLALLVDARELLPTQRTYFHNLGSLTTPPCTEKVTWIVLKKPMTASPGQRRFLQQRLGGPNNRPIQPLDGRVIETAMH